VAGFGFDGADARQHRSRSTTRAIRPLDRVRIGCPWTVRSHCASPRPRYGCTSHRGLEPLKCTVVKIGHCHSENRPLGVKTGQHLVPFENASGPFSLRYLFRLCTEPNI
jgi:hypothetical protein